jgi:predicted nuclease of predicted toxin-antitoxin system
VDFLIDASLPRDTAILLRRLGHEPIDVRDIGLRHAQDADIARYAQLKKLILISADFDFADIRTYPPAEYFGLIVIDRPEDASIAEVLQLLERVLSQRDLLPKLIGHRRSSSVANTSSDIVIQKKPRTFMRGLIETPFNIYFSELFLAHFNNGLRLDHHAVFIEEMETLHA